MESGLADGEVIVSDSDGSIVEESDSGSEDESEAGVIIAKDGTAFVRWEKMAGRTVDPFVQRGYNRRAEFKLHNHTEKKEIDYFESMFPWHLIPEIAALMTTRGCLLGFGGDWTVTRGDVIGFVGMNFAILLFHTGGPKEDLWLNEVSGDYIQ